MILVLNHGCNSNHLLRPTKTTTGIRGAPRTRRFARGKLTMERVCSIYCCCSQWYPGYVRLTVGGCVHLALFLSLFFFYPSNTGGCLSGPLSFVSCKFGGCFRLPVPLSSFCLLLPPALLAEGVAFALLCNFCFPLWFPIFDFVFWVCVLVFILPHLFSICPQYRRLD